MFQYRFVVLFVLYYFVRGKDNVTSITTTTEGTTTVNFTLGTVADFFNKPGITFPKRPTTTPLPVFTKPPGKPKTSNANELNVTLEFINNNPQAIYPNLPMVKPPKYLLLKYKEIIKLQYDRRNDKKPTTKKIPRNLITGFTKLWQGKFMYGKKLPFPKRFFVQWNPRDVNLQYYRDRTQATEAPEQQPTQESNTENEASEV